MKNEIINTVIGQMSKTLDSIQLKNLKETLTCTLSNYEITQSESGIDKSITENAELLESFLSAKKIEGCSDKTIKYYQATIQNLLNHLQISVRSITTSDLRIYLSEYQEQKQSSKVTIDNMRRIFSSFFAWLEDEDYIIKSPVRRIHRVRTDTLIKETISDEALEHLRDSCTEIRDLALIDLLASTGMRVGELVKMNISDINFQERQCIVFGKGNKERMVYLNSACLEAIQNYLQVRPNEGVPVTEKNALFISRNKRRISPKTVQHIVKTYLEKSGLDGQGFSTHKLRHTAATLMYQSGNVDVRVLKDILGHEQLNTTQIYTHVSDSQMEEAMSANPLADIKPKKHSDE